MLDDKYRIEHLLAVGGMGAVYVGTHIKLRKKVAIKVLNPALSNPLMIERFHREAVTASQIGHEGIAQVTDIGTTGEGEPFIVMEYLDGESLATRLKGSGPLPIEVACELGCAILAPLEAAHRAGIVHRDLKPDNVFLVRQSRGEMVKLLDFGISRTAGENGEFRLTTTGLVLGTPYYMSPEQARGDAALGTGADIYAFGVIMYEMLVGSVPIQGDNYNQIMYRVMTGDYIRPRDTRQDIPAELEQVILQAMALDAVDRPPSAAALEQMLLPFCRATFREHTIERISTPSLRAHRPSVAPGGMSTGTERTVLAPTPPASKAYKAVPPPGKSKAPLFAVLALVVVGGGIAGYAMTRGGDAAKDPPAKEPVVVAPPPAALPPPPTPPTPPAPPPVAASSNITLTFDIKPKTALVTLDGKQIVAEELVVAADAGEHELSITAPGYEPDVSKLKLDQSHRLSIQLQKVVSVKPTGKDRPTGKERGRTDRIDTQSPYK
jgi:serine/threonine protein kinase